MEPTTRCPLCGEVILARAVRCKHCQADLRYSGPIEPPLPTHTTLPFESPASPPFPGVQPPAPHAPPPAQPHGDGGHVPAGDLGLTEYTPPSEGEFEHRFLDFAFRTNVPISGASVAYALRVPMAEATAKLEDLAARDVLIREVDSRGFVFFHMPGRSVRESAPNSSTALAPYAHPPSLLYDPPTPTGITRTTTESTALVALLVNALCPPPGIGSLIGGKTTAGAAQIMLFVFGLALCVSWQGLPLGAAMVLGSWIWGLVTGINTLNESKQQNPQTR